MRFALLALALGGFGIGLTEFVALGLLPNLAAFAARLQRKQVLMACFAMFTLGTLASALLPTFEPLLAACFLTVLPHGPLLLPSCSR